MKRSVDPVIARDRVIGGAEKPCTETQRRREKQQQNSTMETQRGEESSFQDFSRQLYIRDSGSSYCLSDHPITCDHRITRSARRSYEILKDLLPRLTTALQILFAAIREIFDESAYDRFLLRTSAARSIASYRAFTHERDASMQKKPRCC
jgi:hypothetical protein